MGLVATSKAAMAAVRSEILVVVREPLFLDEFAPPPVFRLDLTVFDRTFGSISERTEPAADGGALAETGGRGECVRDGPAATAVAASGDGERAGVEAKGLLADM